MKDFKTLKDKIVNGEASQKEIDRLVDYIYSVGREELSRANLTLEDSDDGRERAEMAGIWAKVRELEALSPKEGKSRSMFIRYGFGWVAAAAVLLIGLIGVFVFKPLAGDVPPPLAKGAVKVVTGKNHITLDDGTTVDLNEGSKLSVSAGFGNGERVVELDGEAYFDVVHDPARPFRVRSGEVTTTVLGTAFDVRAYGDSSRIVVTVARGKVAVEDSDGKLAVLEKNQQVTYHRRSGESAVTTLDAVWATEWKEAYLILDGLTMEQAVGKISERFNVNIRFKDSKVQKCHVQMSYVNGEGLERILDDLTSISGSEYKRTSAGIVITGGVSCDDI